MSSDKSKTQKGMTWSSQAAEKARTEHKYIKVGGKGGRLAITGASKMFESCPDYVYIPGLRMAGRRGDVVQVLQKYGQNPEQILANAITADNYESNPDYQQEVSAYEVFKESTKGSKVTKNVVPKYTLRDLPRLVQNLDQLDWVAKTNKTSDGKSQSSDKASRGAKKSIAERLEEARSKGRILDVSTMKDDYTGIRSVDKPEGGRTKKIWIEGLDIMAAPDKFSNYAKVVEQLGPDYSQYIESFKRRIMPGASSVPVSTTVSTQLTQPVQPSTSTVKAVSPKRSGVRPASPRMQARPSVVHINQ